MFRYAIIGNRSFYNLWLNSTPQTRNIVSGYTFPRLFLTKYAVEDPEEKYTKNLLSNNNAESLFTNVIFLNNLVTDGKKTLIKKKDLKQYKKQSDLRVAEISGFHPINSSMISLHGPLTRGDSIWRLRQNSSEGFSAKEIVVGLFNGNPIRDFGESEPIPIHKDLHFYIEIDFGHDNDRVINFVRAEHENPFKGRTTFLEASHNRIDWKRVVYLTYADHEKTPPNFKDWNSLSHEKFRYFRINIAPGNTPIGASDLPQLLLGYKKRNLISKNIKKTNFTVPLTEFNYDGLSKNKKFKLFSYRLPDTVSLDISTDPSQSFAHTFDINWSSNDTLKKLKPTWKDNWHTNDLFQINYQGKGFLTIDVPIGKMSEYLKNSIQIEMIRYNSRLTILDYGAGKLDIAINEKEPSWLYYADTWDKFWEARINGKLVPVNKANLQFKAIFIPPGKQILELKHNPKSFFHLVLLSYSFQIILIVIWLFTMRKVSLAPEH